MEALPSAGSISSEASSSVLVWKLFRLLGRSPPRRPHLSAASKRVSQGCVGGVIKFDTVVGYHGNHSHDDMLLKTWTLSPGHKEWELCTLSPGHKEWELCNTLAVPHLWASDSFRERNLPQLKPFFPIISPDDAEIVNVTRSDIEYEKKVDFFGKVHRGRMLLKAQYLVSINTVKNKVLSSCKLTHEYPRPKFLDLTAIVI
ncbi:fimbrin-like protein 2 [Striga asiatica]|uniref:Fimbrin-like protein 2 n=1 Tax=Striga asiatica TaxID=4170 RepID=A0A5A7RBK9_STRAF|nr:fimbrin-like protein 2 [Striga asiatica]